MYKLTNGTLITRLSDRASIPPDVGNTDYQEYMQWVAAGNMPEPADNAMPSGTPVVVQPMEKLRAFLAANPDVANLLE